MIFFLSILLFCTRVLEIFVQLAALGHYSLVYTNSIFTRPAKSVNLTPKFCRDMRKSRRKIKTFEALFKIEMVLIKGGVK